MNEIDVIQQFGLAKYAIDNGGSIHPLIIPADQTKGTGLMNPSIYLDGNKLLINIRHVNYTLYHSEGKTFQHQFGPLQYLHPEDDRHLRTINFIGELDSKLNLKNICKVDTSKLDVPPIWEFTGLEDARLFRWDGKLFLCGVRRDTTPNGQGRMELSEIRFEDGTYKEVSRVRIPAPGPNTSYCEKNWMPILDKPYHFVKWTNPTEVVKVDISGDGKCTCTTVVLDETKILPIGPDLRGSAQVIPWGDNHLTITHEVNLYNSELGRKDGAYRHRFVVWDKDWNLVHFSPSLSFLTGEIEFCAGATKIGDDLLISFGFQDNAAFILRLPVSLVNKVIGMK